MVAPLVHSHQAPPRKADGMGRKQRAMKTRPTTASARKRSERDQVILEHLPLVRVIAVRVHANLPVYVELEDLVHAGVLGLIDAVVKYNPLKEVAFSSYAKHRIKGSILDSLRQLDWASRDLRRRQRQADVAAQELTAELKRLPTEEELASRMGLEVDHWRRLAVEMHNSGVISASSRSADQEDLPAPDFPAKPETRPDTICVRSQMRSVLTTAIKTLPERYQKVVMLYYTGEMTMKEIGGLMGINESRVSQIHKAALERMAAALEQNGIRSAREF